MDFLDGPDHDSEIYFERGKQGDLSWNQFGPGLDLPSTSSQVPPSEDLKPPSHAMPKRKRQQSVATSEEPIVKAPLDDDADEKTFGKKRKRGRGPRVKDRKKHNEAETQRRRRMKASFTELAKLCGLENPSNAHKAAVLRAAIAKVKDTPSSETSKSDDELEEKEKPTASSFDTGKDKDGYSISSPPCEDNKSDSSSDSNSSPTLDPLQFVSSRCKDLLEENGVHIVSGENPVITLVQFAQNKSKEVQELTEYKKRAEGVISSVVQLLKQQINYHSVFNCSSVAEDIVNFEGRIVDCNILLCRLLGYTKVELLSPSFTFYSITHPDSLAQTTLFIHAIMSGRSRVYQVVKKYITSDQRGLWVRVTAWLARDEAGKPQCIRAILEPFAWGDSVPPLPEIDSPGAQTRQLLAAAQAAQSASALLTAQKPTSSLPA